MFVVSAPGKVILYGEHAVVYGVPAIAASVSLHTYVFVVDSTDPDVIELDFPEVGLVRQWKRSELPWSSVSESGKLHQKLDPETHLALKTLLAPITDPFENAASHAFLYLYLHLCTASSTGRRFITRSTLPIGAGLGSSASYSVGLAAALLKLGGVIQNPSPSLSAENLELINGWSYLGESCIHGNPSGIDNIVATRGGAVLYERGAAHGSSKIEPYKSFPPLGLILTNTKVPRQTSQLVSDVGTLKSQLPDVVDPILSAIAAVVSRADRLIRSGCSADQLNESLRELAQINHGLLVSLGVSHPTLERVRQAAHELEIGQTKLTGAGGGGCAITIVDGEVSEKRFCMLKKALGDGFDLFETELGGRGVGMAELPSAFSVDQIRELKGASEFHDLGDWNYW